ncbi:hypothetical protein GCM10022288_21970 [Gryllotalpicola kribbensis]|jgi:hypothetical protein|uniref:Uncharacterized protein n=1 Tax=Gryllotalpicola kribbensis TaxID=993084 RepID=A0ABP8AV81_9MICO
MHTLTVTLGLTAFTLKPGTSVRKLEKRIVSALRRGAGVIRLPLAGGGNVDAIVSRGLMVTVNRQETPQPEAGAAQEAWAAEAALDLDEWGTTS